MGEPTPATVGVGISIDCAVQYFAGIMGASNSTFQVMQNQVKVCAADYASVLPPGVSCPRVSDTTIKKVRCVLLWMIVGRHGPSLFCSLYSAQSSPTLRA